MKLIIKNIWYGFEEKERSRISQSIKDMESYLRQEKLDWMIELSDELVLNDAFGK